MEAVKSPQGAGPRRVGVVQMRCEPDHDRNLRHALDAIADAAREGADVVCLPELFRTPYLCQSEDPSRFDWAEPIPGPTTEALAKQAEQDQETLGASLLVLFNAVRSRKQGVVGQIPLADLNPVDSPFDRLRHQRHERTPATTMPVRDEHQSR